MVLNGKIKNQTVKQEFTVIVTNDYGDEIINQTVMAESAREAVCKVFPFLVDPAQQKEKK